LSNQLAENAQNIISYLLDKLGVSLLATVADKTANERINQLINHATVSGDLNSQKFSRVLDQWRIDEGILKEGIIVFLNANKIQFVNDGNSEEPPLWGVADSGGYALIRKHCDPVVLHEVGHMLGIGENCKNARCLMNYVCPPGFFCDNCLNIIHEAWGH
jgi:hypothetical protein